MCCELYYGLLEPVVVLNGNMVLNGFMVFFGLMISYGLLIVLNGFFMAFYDRILFLIGLVSPFLAVIDLVQMETTAS